MTNTILIIITAFCTMIATACVLLCAMLPKDQIPSEGSKEGDRKDTTV